MKKLFDSKTDKPWATYESIHTMDSWRDAVGTQPYSNILGDAIDRISIVSFANLEGTIIQVNANFEKISGYKNSELTGKNYCVLNAAYHSKKFWQEMQETISKGETWRGEIKNKAKDGSYFWVDTTIVPLVNNEGNVSEYMSVQNDITARKNAEQKIVNQNNTTEFAINAVEIGIWEWYADTEEFTCNDYMCKHLGLQRTENKFTCDDFVGRLHPEDVYKFDLMRDAALTGQSIYQNEYRVVLDNGDINHISTKGIVVREGNGRPIKIIGASLNITDLKKNEDELKRKQRLLDLAIEAGEIGVFDWEIETRKTIWNSFMHQHLGLSVEEFDGTDDSFTRQVHPKDRESIIKAVEESIRLGKPVDIEYAAVLSDNSLNYIKCRGILIKDVSGNPKRIVGVCLNITKLKHAEAELHTKQEVLNLAIEAGEIGVFSWDIKQGILTGNKYINQHYGFAENKVAFTLDEFRAILHPQDISKVVAATENNFHNKVKSEIDYRVVLADGRVHNIASSGILSRDADGNAERMVGVVINVTKQKELEVTLWESEKKFRSAMRDSAIGMALVGIDGRYLEVNKALLDILGYDELELLNMKVQDITYADDLKRELEYVDKLISGETEPQTTEKRYVHKDGSIIWGQLNGSMVKNDAGELLYFIAQIQDITLRKQIDEKLQEHNQKLEAANNELESFSYSVSHDLRAPLRIINGYVEILKEDFGDKFSEEGKQVIETLLYNANKMGHLIDDILEFSRMNRKGLEKNLIDTDAMVRGIILELKGLETGRNIDIKIGNLHSVFADIQMLRQVWFNLIQNAIKYTRKKSNALIEIDSYKESGNTCFFIRDNGVGFNMKYVHKLFEVFQRLHSSTEFEGTGVGLAIVKRIISRHGGGIWVNAKENEGATFYFTVPDDYGK